ncbi:preprotein translocase subunit SecE [Ligilactobacillus sp. LYQ135]
MRFIKEVVQTMKDTTWETGKETRKDTTTVVVMSLALIAFFAVVDGIAQGLINFI